MIRPFVLGSMLALLPACASMRLSGAAEQMIRIERGTSAVVDGVVAFKDTTKADCVARQLPTEDERAACVQKAVRAVDVSEKGVLAIKAALASFWELYGIIEAARSSDGTIRREYLVEILARAGKVVAAYGEFVKAVKEAKT